MPPRTVQLVLHYDGTDFAGWQRQRDTRTVQGVLEGALASVCGEPVAVLGAGRTDAGVHARGQAASVRVAERWAPATLRRAVNAKLPGDVWIAAAHGMHPEFHARYSALARRYVYHVGTDDRARSPFRRRWTWALGRALDRQALDAAAAAVVGDHRFVAFAVRGTAPPRDAHRCTVREAGWRPTCGGVRFAIVANRFLHHMVRFLVGTMVDIALGRRAPDAIGHLLQAGDNSEVSAPAPPHALFLDRVDYPPHLYLSDS